MQTDVYITKNMKSFTTASTGNGGEIVMTLSTPQGDTQVAEVVRYPISNAGVIVAPEKAGGWARLIISSEYQGNQARIKIEQK